MNPANRILRLLATVLLAVLLCSCAATSIKHTWKSPDCPKDLGKIAVVAMEERGIVRQGFENRLVAQLAKAGAPAMVTFDLLTLAEIEQNKQVAAERFRAAGADAVLIMRLVDQTSSYREVMRGRGAYITTITGWENVGWYDYYSVGFLNLTPTYGTLKQKILVETGLFDLKTEACLWSGLSQTVMKENMDRVAEMDPLVEKVVAAMQKDGVFRSAGSGEQGKQR